MTTRLHKERSDSVVYHTCQFKCLGFRCKSEMVTLEGGLVHRPAIAEKAWQFMLRLKVPCGEVSGRPTPPTAHRHLPPSTTAVTTT